MSKNIHKILMYIDTMNLGGAQRVMGNLAEYFAGKGVEVVLVNDFVALPGVKQYDLPLAIKRMYLRKDLGGNLILKNIERIKNLRKIINDENPDIVLSFLGATNLRMLIATIGLPLKKVVSVRNDPNKEYGTSFIRKFIAKQLFKLADGCVFQTRQASEYFTEDVRKKSEIIYNPVAQKFYDAKLKKHRKNIITVGRLAPQKNHKLLIEAFAQIADTYPKDNLIIYGEGPLHDELASLVERLNLKNRVFLPGEEQDIVSKLEESKIFVLSSDYEGMPNALMEAMTVGLPCISTDCPCGGPRELIEDGVEGILFPVGDISKLKNALLRMLENDNMCKTMGEFAQKKSLSLELCKVLKKWEEYLLK